MSDLSIIIVSWNTELLLAGCLASVASNVSQLAAYKVEVVVVDNASTDSTLSMLRQQYSWVRVIASEQNLGFAGANNRGIEQSSGNYIMLLNPDTILLDGALAALLEFMSEHLEVGAVGSRLLNPDHTLQMSCYPFPTLFREFWRLLHLDILYPLALYPVAKWAIDLPREVDVLQGAALIVRRDIVEAIGLLDEDYFMYTEEVDWCRRIKGAGWRNYWLPASQVIHFGGQSTKQVAGSMFLQLYQSKLRYFRKHSGALAGFTYKLILLVGALLRLISTPLIRILPPEARAENYALARRYAALIRQLPGM
jgi:hypothetical protein